MWKAEKRGMILNIKVANTEFSPSSSLSSPLCKEVKTYKSLCAFLGVYTLTAYGSGKLKKLNDTKIVEVRGSLGARRSVTGTRASIKGEEM